MIVEGFGVFDELLTVPAVDFFCFSVDEILMTAEGADEDLEVLRMEMFFCDVVEGEHEQDNPQLGGWKAQNQLPARKGKGKEPDTAEKESHAAEDGNRTPKDELEYGVEVAGPGQRMLCHGSYASSDSEPLY